MAEFDPQKAAFYLVAIVIATMMAVVLAMVFGCVVVGIMKVQGGVCADAGAFIKEIIQMSFTAAVAFAGGRMSAPYVPPPPKLPEKTPDPIKESP